jgi:hypothetical protein
VVWFIRIGQAKHHHNKKITVTWDEVQLLSQMFMNGLDFPRIHGHFRREWLRAKVTDVK